MRDLSRDDSAVKFRGPGKRARSDARKKWENLTAKMKIGFLRRGRKKEMKKVWLKIVQQSGLELCEFAIVLHPSHKHTSLHSSEHPSCENAEIGHDMANPIMESAFPKKLSCHQIVFVQF